MTTLLSLAFHPGHGTTDPHTWRHYLTEPLHVVGIVAALAVLGLLVFFWRRRAARN